MTESEEELFAKWTDWLNRIEHEQIEPLLVFRHIFAQMTAVTDRFIGASLPAYEVAEHFRLGYAAYACMTMRRITEKQASQASRRTISLRILLEGLIPHIGLITRKRLRPRYGFDHRRFADRDFDVGVGEPGHDSLPEAVVRRDLEGLTTGTEKVKLVADKVIAHTPEAEHSSEGNPTFGEVNRAIDLIESIFRRYRLLITAQGGDIFNKDFYDVTADFERLFQHPTDDS